MKWLDSLLNKNTPDQTDPVNTPADVRRLEMELAEKNAQIERLTREINQVQLRHTDEKAAVSENLLEQVIAKAAPAVSQLTLQAYLQEEKGVAVNSQDVLNASRRLIRSLEQFGMEITGKVGETVCFDPNLHQSLSLDVSLEKDSPAVIRICGVSFKGKVLQKISVERREDAA